MRGDDCGGLGEEEFGDLDGIEGGSFADLVTDNPEGEGVGEDLIFADATDEAVVLAGGVEGDGVAGLGWVVDEFDPGSVLVDGLSFGDGGIFFEKGGDGDGVGAHDGDADAGAGDFEVGKVEDFSSFEEHFLFFFGVAVVEEGIDVGDEIVGDLARVDFGFDGLPVDEGVDLGFEFDDSLGTAAGDGLVSGGDEAFESEGAVEGGEAHQSDDGGAVGIGDDVFGVLVGGLGVDFGNDQGDLRVHAESGGVINDETAGGGGVGGKFEGDVSASGEKGKVEMGEGVFGEFLDDEVFSAKGDGRSGGAGGGEQGEVGKGEVTFFEAKKHFTANGSGGSNDGDAGVIFHGRRRVTTGRSIAILDFMIGIFVKK